MLYTSLTFKPFSLPTGEQAWVPTDIELHNPESTNLAPDLLHYLIYLPWHAQYLERVPTAYQNFFQNVLPHLRARSTDVHVASCLPFVAELSKAVSEPVDLAVIYVAFILHDTGWSLMSDLEVAESLGVQGLALSGAAVNPKARHAVLGKEVAVRILADYTFEPPLTQAQKELICKAILFHDKPWELAAGGDIPTSVKLVCDVDHLWSFTHENFWQDTVRKGVRPDVYAANLADSLEGYFVTEAGKHKAGQLLAERQAEVAVWAQQPPL
jgi:HD domain